MKKELRLQAMKWWNEKTLDLQFYITIEYKSDLVSNDAARHPSTLTGSEIELLYKKIHML